MWVVIVFFKGVGSESSFVFVFSLMFMSWTCTLGEVSVCDFGVPCSFVVCVLCVFFVIVGVRCIIVSVGFLASGLLSWLGTVSFCDSLALVFRAFSLWC